MPPHADAIADCVIGTFNSVPTKFKPRTLADGRREEDDHVHPYTSSTSSHALTSSKLTPSLTCAALATGMKCLPQSKVEQAKGNVLHDWHAEILALRAFNRFLVDECANLAARGNGVESNNGNVGKWVRWRHTHEDRDPAYAHDNSEDVTAGEHHQPFELHPDVGIHMYISEAPCGDASMELTMAEQEDATPWPTPTTTVPTTTNDDPVMLGRGHFNHLGIVRRKPSRHDAPPTLSKSCSDKLALKQCTSLLSSLTSRVVWPGNVYLSTLVLPGGQIVPEAVERAFARTGRMKGVVDSEVWKGAGYGYRAFEVRRTGREFEFSKRCSGKMSTTSSQSTPGAVPSNLSALYTPHKQEILINGVLQGRKLFDPCGASCVSRKAMWQAALDLALLSSSPAVVAGLSRETYGEMKACSTEEVVEGREQVKRDVRTLALKGWKRNVGDEEWGLDQG